MTRRISLGIPAAAAFAVAAGVTTLSLHAQQRVPPAPQYTQVADGDLKIVYLAGTKSGGAKTPGEPTFANMYAIVGGGSDRHTVSLELDDGTLLLDTKPARLGARLLEKVKLATANPVTIIVNSNPGGAASNAIFTDVVDIYAHENTKARLAKMDAFKGPNARFLPNKTFKDKLTVPLQSMGASTGTNRLDMYYFGRAHSDGDLIAVLPAFALAYFGELLPGRMTPTIDVENGGSTLAFADTLDRAIEGLKDAGVENIVPAHAPAPYKAILRWMSLRDLRDYAEFMRAFVNATKAAHAAGKSVDDAVAGLMLPEKFKAYGMQTARANVESIYSELKR